MQIVNCWLRFRKYYVVSVAVNVAAGSNTVRLTCSKTIEFPSGTVFRFGAVQVELTQPVTLSETSTLVNCLTLTADIAAGQTNLDLSSGIPQETFVETIAEASLEEVNRPLSADMPGVDSTSIALEGRLVNPRTLAPEFRVQDKIAATYQRGTTEQLRGWFYVLPSVGSRFGLEKIFGDFLSGYMQVGVGT